MLLVAMMPMSVSANILKITNLPVIMKVVLTIGRHIAHRIVQICLDGLWNIGFNFIKQI